MQSNHPENQMTETKWLTVPCANDACKREIHLVAVFPMFVIHSPRLACSGDCLMAWEKEMEAYFERSGA